MTQHHWWHVAREGLRWSSAFGTLGGLKVLELSVRTWEESHSVCCAAVSVLGEVGMGFVPWPHQEEVQRLASTGRFLVLRSGSSVPCLSHCSWHRT